MNLAFLKVWWKPLVVLVVVILPLVAALHYYGKATDEQRRADTAEQNLKLANDTITDMHTRQRDVAALDAKYTGELADAQETIDQLERDITAGHKRLRLNATCSPNGTSSPGGMGNAPSTRLTDSAQRDYFTLLKRVEMITTQVGYLQQFITEQCK